MANFTEENIYKIEKWVEYINNGHYGNARDIVDTYNSVFDGVKQKQNYTNCGSCLKRCVITMNNALNEYRQSLKTNETEVVETVEEVVEEAPKKKGGRPKKVV